MPEESRPEEFGVILVDGYDEKILSLDSVFVSPTPDGLALRGDNITAVFVAGRAGVVSYYHNLRQFGFRCRLGGFFGGQTVYWMFDDCYKPTYMVALGVKELEGQPYARLSIADYLASDFKRVLAHGDIESGASEVQQLTTMLYHVQRIVESYPTHHKLYADFNEPGDSPMPQINSYSFCFPDDSSLIVASDEIYPSTSYTCGIAEKMESDQVTLVVDSPMNTMPGHA